jgi:hypothetical protein
LSGTKWLETSAPTRTSSFRRLANAPPQPQPTASTSGIDRSILLEEARTSSDIAGGVDGDLTNRKLAENQRELYKQISELRETVEVHGTMVRRLLEVLEGQAARPRSPQ